MSLEKQLINYGLNDKEVKVYLACLECGGGSAPRLSRKTTLPKSTVYGVLEKLKDRGLVSSFKKRNILYFSVDDPQKALRAVKEKLTSFEAALPGLYALYGQAKDKPGVRFYQGTRDMKNILLEILDEADELLAFSSAGDIFSTLNESLPQFVSERAKRKIPSRVLLWDSPVARQRRALGPQELRQVRIIPEKYRHNGAIMLWKNKIAMFSLKKELVALVIESQELAAAARAMFEFIWDTAKP